MKWTVDRLERLLPCPLSKFSWQSDLLSNTQTPAAQICIPSSVEISTCISAEQQYQSVQETFWFDQDCGVSWLLFFAPCVNILLIYLRPARPWHSINEITSLYSLGDVESVMWDTVVRVIMVHNTPGHKALTLKTETRRWCVRYVTDTLKYTLYWLQFFTFIISCRVNVIINYGLATSNSTHTSIPVRTWVRSRNEHKTLKFETEMRPRPRPKRWYVWSPKRQVRDHNPATHGRLIWVVVSWWVRYDMYLMFCTIAIYCVFVLPYFFLKGHRKSLSEPGVSCSTSMFLVCIATSLVFWTNKMMMMISSS